MVDLQPVVARFRFYAELNDFLSPQRRQLAFEHPCASDASVKHMIEALGVPHTEVALILVDGVSVGFAYRLRHGERVSVYPAFTALDMEQAVQLRPPWQDTPRFVADAHLGQLAKNLRMLGFDVLYRNDYSDAEVVRLAVDDGRIVLTRDRDLLIRKDILYGCYLHAIASEAQLLEVVGRYRLAGAARAFSRCLNCNGMLQSIPKEAVGHRVPQHSHRIYRHFYECQGCSQVYWEGSHVARMRARLAPVLDTAGISL